MGHDIAAISIPSFLVLVGILLNQRGHDKLDARMTQLENKLEAKIEVLQRDLREFYRLLGQHDKAIEVLEKKL